MSPSHVRNIFFFLFAVSGFTGLIYESIWSHYLKLFLGHAAYAQALVLAIFMGGMALGAWLASRSIITNRKNLLVTYALIEGIIGVLGIFFHPVFQSILDISFDIIIPELGSPFTVQIYKWTVSTLLILPQSILLGMTFPLMSNGIIRAFPEMQGKSLAILYFTNSLGAAVGVLVSGFVLIATVGLPGTILFAGIVNVMLAIIVYGFIKRKSLTENSKINAGLKSNLAILLLGSAFVTGLASFIYEIAWIRMLSMVLGTSTHSFELMLSAFITGLAFGGLWIKNRIDHYSNLFIVTGVIQLLMGICALLTVPLYNYTYELMVFFMSGLNNNDAGYSLFTLASHLINFLVMLPATFCAGMTLPLFTKILLAQGYGEKSIGQVYAFNTLGAITGVILTIFILMPFYGLKSAIIIGAACDMLLGMILLFRSGLTHNLLPYPSIICLLLIFSTVIFTEFDFRRMTSTVYRYGNELDISNTNLLFHKDGKTSTVHVIERNGYQYITTNGKPDATIYMGTNTGISAPDETTMVLAAALPLAIQPDVRTAAIIGMGSGLTTHTLLAWPGIEIADTIEIESAMVDGAKFFRPRVERAFTDLRSHIYIDDAKTFFSSRKKKYDLIISEPSNPWVSGVSSLFTDEFYRQIKTYLNQDGIFVQWVQMYEINLTLVLNILNSIQNNFHYYALYTTVTGDILILAKEFNDINIPKNTVYKNNTMRNELELIGLRHLQDIKTRFIADEKIINPLIKLYRPAINSDYFPILDLNAPRARFKQEDVYELNLLGASVIPFTQMLYPEMYNDKKTVTNQDDKFKPSKLRRTAVSIYDYLLTGETADIENVDLTDIDILLNISRNCSYKTKEDLWIDKLQNFAINTVPYLTPDEFRIIWGKVVNNCNSEVLPVQQLWLNLLEGLGNRNPEIIADNSLALLKHSKTTKNKQRRYLFANLLLALVTMDEYIAAIKLWKQIPSDLFTDKKFPLEMELLYAIAVDKIDNSLNK